MNHLMSAKGSKCQVLLEVYNRESMRIIIIKFDELELLKVQAL